MEKYSRQKGEWIYILGKKFKFYTKEIVKLINIIAIGIFIIIAIILLKFKPIYTVYLNGENIGYIKSKSEFEKLIEEKLCNNKEENIAFIEPDIEIKYAYKLIEKETNIDEEQALLAIKENACITYFQYAVSIDGVEKEYLRTEETAKQLADNIRNELGEETNISVQTVYTKELKAEKEAELANIANEIVQEVKEENRKKAATIDGIYLAVTPVSGNITSRYGSREEVRNHTHQGLDIAAKTGTPIKAVADGTITYSGTMGGYGNIIIINHGNGIETYYGHCSKLYAKVGTNVTAGETIAAVGSTGNSTGSHLHFEIRQNGEYVNPQNYLYK